MKKVKLLFLSTLIFCTFSVHAFASDATGVTKSVETRTSTKSIDKKGNGVHHEIETVDDMRVIATVWQRYMQEHPNASEEEQEAFLKKYEKEHGFSSAKDFHVTSSYGDLLPGYNRLNKVERNLAKKNATQAAKVYICASDATGYTMDYYGYDGYQDNSDAFRHCCWNALMKKEIGFNAAVQWATAHESDQSGIDKEMDLFNNVVGRNIDVEGKNKAQIAKKVKAKVKKGKCRRISNNTLVATDGAGLIK